MPNWGRRVRVDQEQAALRGGCCSVTPSSRRLATPRPCATTTLHGSVSATPMRHPHVHHVPSLCVIHPHVPPPMRHMRDSGNWPISRLKSRLLPMCASGKYVEIRFGSEDGALLGAAVRTYLLERSRVVHVNDPERSYHIFYQVGWGGQGN